MRYNDIPIIAGQRWRYRRDNKGFVGEVVTFRSHDSVDIKIIQTMNQNYYPVGKVIQQTMNDIDYAYLEGQDAIK